MIGLIAVSDPFKMPVTGCCGGLILVPAVAQVASSYPEANSVSATKTNNIASSGSKIVSCVYKATTFPAKICPTLLICRSSKQSLQMPPVSVVAWSAIRVLSIASKPLQLLSHACQRTHSYLVNSLRSDNKVIPKRCTVVLSLILFSFYLILGFFAVRSPMPEMRIAVLVTCSGILVMLLAKIANDFRCDRKSNPRYGRNLMNGVLTVVFSLIVFTILYHKRWCHRLRLPVVQVTHDAVVSVEKEGEKPAS